MDEVDILAALNGLLKMVKEINKLSTKSLSSWPTYIGTLNKIQEEDGEATFQYQVLKSYQSARALYSRNHQAYCSSVTECLKSRLEWSDLNLIRDIIFILETQGWQKVIDEEQEAEAVDRVAERFKNPLEAAGVEITELRKEFKEMLEHSVEFISLCTLSYQEVWWRLFHAPYASQWSNILTLAELLFSLPASNGKLERCSSTLKIIKTDRRCSLNNDTLDDLLILNTDKEVLQDFNPRSAIDLWWKAKSRKPLQQPRQQYARHQRSEDAANSDEPAVTEAESQSDDDHKDSEVGDSIILDDWDEWLNDD